MPEPKKNTAFVFILGLVDQANRPAFKVNPTIAAGDFQVSTDGGAFANLATLPVVEPSGSEVVKISLSVAEMNGDRVVVRGKDVAGSEWDDVLAVLDTTVKTVDDPVDVGQFGGSTEALEDLKASAGTIVRGTVDTATFSPTTTQFETGGITEATTDHFKGRVIIFTAGALKDQARDITGYVLANGKGKFTVTALTEAPANTDPFVVV